LSERKPRKKNIGVTGYILKPMYATLKETIRATIHRPNTVLYPWEKLVLPDNYRGRPGLIMDRCIGCGICMRICPTKCIELVEVEYKDQGKVKRPKVNLGRCMMCGYCAEYCPKNAMIVTPEYELAAFTREDLIFDPYKLQHEYKPGYEVHLVEVTPSELKKGVVAAPAERKPESKDKPELDDKKCIGCSRCAKVCPAGAIEMIQVGVSDKGKPIKRPKFDYKKCVSCEQCVENCPRDALAMKEAL
jgi:NADH-quinone oxidoreductase subunit I/NAD(P)H-quinone oxidoreductase subunit I